MRRILGMAVGTLLLAAPAHAAPTGLIGKWMLVPEPDKTCHTLSYVFTATTETDEVGATASYPASKVMMAVRYVGDESEVYAVGPNGPSSAARWQILDSNHVRETSFTGCEYQRTK